MSSDQMLAELRTRLQERKYECKREVNDRFKLLLDQLHVLGCGLSSFQPQDWTICCINATYLVQDEVLVHPVLRFVVPANNHWFNGRNDVSHGTETVYVPSNLAVKIAESVSTNPYIFQERSVPYVVERVKSWLSILPKTEVLCFLPPSYCGLLSGCQSNTTLTGICIHNSTRLQDEPAVPTEASFNWTTRSLMH
jgi:hypothetical protein